MGEIAEQKGVSRQSVSDCLNKCRKQLEVYEQKLGFLNTLTQLSREYSAYMTTVERWLAQRGEDEAARKLKADLKALHEEFGVEIIQAE